VTVSKERNLNVLISRKEKLMDPYLHTIIAIGCMAVSFYAGQYYGKRLGFRDMIHVLLGVFKAESLEITEDGNFFITKEDGIQTKVN
jgi:hypothetical protein